MQSELNYIPKIAFIANPSSDNHLDYIRLYKDIFNLDQKVCFAANCDRTIELELPTILYLSTPILLLHNLSNEGKD